MLSESDLSLARGQRSRKPALSAVEGHPYPLSSLPEQGFLASLGMTVMTKMLDL